MAAILHCVTKEIQPQFGRILGTIDCSCANYICCNLPGSRINCALLQASHGSTPQQGLECKWRRPMMLSRCLLLTEETADYSRRASNA